jgi:hypothetical protein
MKFSAPFSFPSTVHYTVQETSKKIPNSFQGISNVSPDLSAHTHSPPIPATIISTIASVTYFITSSLRTIILSLLRNQYFMYIWSYAFFGTNLHNYLNVIEYQRH